MWKLSTLLFVAALGLASSQNAVTLDCDYFLYFGEYVCELYQIEVLDPTTEVTFGGTHLEGRTELEVDVVWVIDSNTPFMIQSIFTTFPNINELTVDTSNLQSISLPSESRVEWLFLYGNNISRLEAGSVPGPSIMYYFEAAACRISDIDEGFFDGMPNTRFIDVSINNITELAPGRFAPGAIMIDLFRNELTVIEEDVFATNTNLLVLYLDQNFITDIHHNFINSLSPSMSYVVLSQNECISGYFNLENENLRMMANNALNQCFRNFNRLEGDQRSIAMQVPPGVTFTDEFGNAIFRA